MEFWREGISDVGVIQGDHAMTAPERPVQVASVQSLARRSFPATDLVIVDEAHRRFEIVKSWMGKRPGLPFIGLSATPWARGLGQDYDDLIVAATTAELIEAGYLSRFRVFAPSHPDLSGVRTVAGDYHEGELSGAMQPLTGDVVATWLEHGDNLPTLCFAVDCAHAKHLHERFESVGVSSAYVDASTDLLERERIRKAFHSGEVKVVCNVGVLCLDEETEILTARGWAGIDDMTDDHDVAAWSEDGIDFTKPVHIVRRDRKPEEKMVAVDGRVHNIRVTGNHRMLWSQSPANFKVRPAEELVDMSGFIPVSGEANPAKIWPNQISAKKLRIRENGLSYKYRKQGVDPVFSRSKAADHQAHIVRNAPKRPTELTQDECEFIGFWLGDGSRSNGRFNLCQSERYPSIVRWVDRLLERLSLHYTREVRAATKSNHLFVRWHLSTGRGGGDQRRNGGVSSLIPYLEKSGSPLLWGLDKAQLKSLLKGYWLADGNHGDGEVRSERGWEITGTRKELFDLLQAVAACRGIRASIHVAPSRNGNKPLCSFRWIEQSASRLVRERLQFEKGWKPERVWCVTSTTGNIITRRKGKVAVLGNTTGVDWDVRCLILARPTKSEMLYCQVVGRALRTAEGKESALILDHSDTTLRLGFVTDIHHDELDDGSGRKKATSGTDGSGPALPKECPKCTYLKPPKAPHCPSCGFKPERQAAGVEIADGELVEMESKAKAKLNREAEWDEKAAFISELRCYANQTGKKVGWVAYKYREKYGCWPNDKRVKDVAPAASVSPKVQGWIRSRAIAWGKTRPSLGPRL